MALRSKNRDDLHEDGPLRHRLLSPMADLDEDGPLRHRLLSPIADLDERRHLVLHLAPGPCIVGTTNQQHRRQGPTDEEDDAHSWLR